MSELNAISVRQSATFVHMRRVIFAKSRLLTDTFLSTLKPMQSIIRFLVVMGVVLSTVLLWRPEVTSSASTPPKASGNSSEEVERALGSLHRAPAQDQWSKALF